MANKILIILIIIILGLPLLLPNLIEVDIFYHFKTSQNLLHLKVDNHLSYIISPTDLDHHFLHHLLLAPFTLFGFPLGVKLFNLFFNLLFFISFIWLFKKFNLKHPNFWFIILLISSSLFLYRINLGRTQTISIIFLLLIVYALVKNKRLLLFSLSFFYVWLFNGFTIIFVLLAGFFLTNLITKSPGNKIITYSLLGTIGGLVINPFFPNNLSFIYQHSIKTTFNNILNSNIPVGMEWNTYPILNFILDNPVMVILIVGLLIVAFLLAISKRQFESDKKDKNLLYFIAFITICFFILTLKSFRFIEYFAPFLILLSAVACEYLKRIQFHPELLQIIIKFKLFLKKPFITIIIALSLISLFIVPLEKLMADFTNADSIDKYKTTSIWLKNNTPEKSIVFHTNWDVFPRLFFYNDHNRYLVGLDPTFMYLYDKNLYWLWRNITEKSIACDLQEANKCSAKLKEPRAIAQAIKTRFNSQYIWVNEYCIYQDFKKFLAENPEYFEKKIETEDSAVFEIIN